jgi:N-acetylglucosaminyldiphosphoundecaprenol N-acetyl-beta-D-mannosaminyltransferase
MFRKGIRDGWKFSFVGATPEVLNAGLEVLRARYPGLAIDGHHGYFDLDATDPDSDNEKLVAWLNETAPDVVIVGMGMPRQEEWICRVLDRVPIAVFLPAGGYLDYQVGVQRRAPRWLGQIGLEWAYRLIHSPRRLGHRYLVEPFILGKRLLTAPAPRSKD